MLAPMHWPSPARFAPLLILLVAPRPAIAQGEAPLAIHRQAQHAVESDSVSTWRARWSARLAASPSDRAARLGIALLDDLTYLYPAAERGYRALTDTSVVAPDRYTAFATLAWAQMDDARGAVGEASS